MIRDFDMGVMIGITVLTLFGILRGGKQEIKSTLQWILALLAAVTQPGWVRPLFPENFPFRDFFSTLIIFFIVFILLGIFFSIIGIFPGRNHSILNRIFGGIIAFLKANTIVFLVLYFMYFKCTPERQKTLEYINGTITLDICRKGYAAIPNSKILSDIDNWVDHELLNDLSKDYKEKN
jgi:uncharacterized membrane protein required for colicin V production